MNASRPRSNRFKIFITLAVLLLLGWLFWQHSTATRDSLVNKASDGSQASGHTPSSATTVRLIATGDMLPHDTVNQAARTSSGYNYQPLFAKVAPYLKSGDISFCNQESPSDSQLKVSGYPTFNAPARFAEDLSALGCNLINLANNHANDRGQAGIDATRQLWERLPTLAVAGTARSAAEQNKVALFRKGGITFAFLAYAKCSNSALATSYGLNTLSRPLVDRQIAAARTAGAQMIIVATHWCRENVSRQDADQDRWASYLASKGVDIVIGTGPHWLQPVKQLPKAGGGKTVVWFSLGNFLSSQTDVNGLIGGIAVMEIDIKTHTVSKLGFMPTYMHYEWTAAQAAREDLLARHNLMIYPLDQATVPLSRSQNHTTVAAQTARVTKLLNTYTHVDILTSRTFGSYGQ